MTCKQIWRLKKCHVVEKRQDQTDHFDTDKTDHFDVVKDIQRLTMLQKIGHVQEKCSANTGTCLIVCLILKHQQILAFTSLQFCFYCIWSALEAGF